MALNKRKYFLVVVNIFIAVILDNFESLWKFYIFNSFLVKQFLILKQPN